MFHRSSPEMSNAFVDQLVLPPICKANAAESGMLRLRRFGGCGTRCFIEFRSGFDWIASTSLSFLVSRGFCDNKELRQNGCLLMGRQSPPLPFRPPSRRSGSVPGEPCPPLRYFQSGSTATSPSMSFHRTATPRLTLCLTPGVHFAWAASSRVVVSRTLKRALLAFG